MLQESIFQTKERNNAEMESLKKLKAIGHIFLIKSNGIYYLSVATRIIE